MIILNFSWARCEKCPSVRPSVCPEIVAKLLDIIGFPFVWYLLSLLWVFGLKNNFTCPTPRCWRADFLFFSCFLGDTLGRRFWPILGVLIFIFAFMVSMRNSPGGKFFVWPDFHFLALGMGPKLVPDQNFEKFQKKKNYCFFCELRYFEPEKAIKNLNFFFITTSTPGGHFKNFFEKIRIFVPFFLFFS